MKKEKLLPLAFFVLCILFFFKLFFLQGKLPISSDTIIGLYHPFRDLYVKEYPNGIPFKNFLITDPVRQQYPWREIVIAMEKKFQLPLWSPYTMAGSPLLANQQSAAFYPLNFLFFFLPFWLGWSILIILCPLLAGAFLYLYLINLRLHPWASVLGAFAFAFCGFSISWMEWGTIGHVALWLPLSLLSIDKIFSQFKAKKFSTWSIIFAFSLTSSFFAGHLQTFFYLFLISIAYFLARWIQNGKDKKIVSFFIILSSLFLIITAIQWLPTVQLIGESARNVDQADWQKDGWFIPWQHLIQFVAPDFFGNPTTLNYWGSWNYGEFVGYIGIFPLIMAIFALFFRRDKKTLFFGTILFVSLIFSLPTIFAKLPYIFNIPLLSTAQPTRLLFLTDFSLAILSALGFDYFLRRKKEIVFPLGFFTIIFAFLWGFILFGGEFLKISPENIAVAKRNLIFPTSIFVLASALLLFLVRFSKRSKPITIMIYIIIVGITVFDLQRFASKFIPFTDSDYLFPNTSALSFLQKQPGNFRIMTTDNRILPPNFSTIYRIQSIDGYDPLYLRRYGELIAASQRGKPDISPPFGFNRIITPHRYDSKIIDLLNVKYILSLSDISSPKLTKVFQEGQTRVYENQDVMPRVFFVQEDYGFQNKNQAVEKMFEQNFDLKKMAVVEFPGQLVLKRSFPVEHVVGKAEIVEYHENKVIIKTENLGDGFLVLTDTFYPSWHVTIDEKESMIYRTDYNFRGVFVPKGKHTIEFYITLL